MDIRKLVADEIALRKWSVYRLGQESGVNDQTIARWLSGERKLNSEYLEKILVALDFEIGRKNSPTELD